MLVEFLGRSKREYRGKDGSPRIAHNIGLLLPSGEVGQLFVSQRVFEQTDGFEKGDHVEVEVEFALYNGKVELRPAGLRAA